MNDNDIYEVAFNRVKDLANSRDISASKIVVLVILTIRAVESVSNNNIDGSAKKKVVIRIVSEWINTIGQFNNEDHQYLNDIFITQILDGLIDSLCDFNIEHIIKTCFQSFLSCIKKSQ